MKFLGGGEGGEGKDNAMTMLCDGEKSSLLFGWAFLAWGWCAEGGENEL